MEYKKDFSLLTCNSFHTQANAKLICFPEKNQEIIEALKEFPKEKKLILGGGCNIFFTKDFNGLVIKPMIKGIREISQIDDEVLVEAGASEDWDRFVAHCVHSGWSGLENLSYIPGTVGASPIQNIGAYGAEVGDCIERVHAIDMLSGEPRTFTNEECGFGYRESIFKQERQYIITSVVFRLNLTFTYKPKYLDLNEELKHLVHPTLDDVRSAVISIRQRKLPDEKVLPNAGSFFKNPYISKEKADLLRREYPEILLYPYSEESVKIPAAFLIEQAGFKGKRSGNIGTYSKQPLILVNYGTTDGNEIISFMKEIQHAVYARFEISLEPEVRIL